eukprot:252893-Pyramimonas_sp.AAC.1
MTSTSSASVPSSAGFTRQEGMSAPPQPALLHGAPTPATPAVSPTPVAAAPPPAPMEATPPPHGRYPASPTPPNAQPSP